MTKKGIKNAIISILSSHGFPMTVENLVKHMVKRGRGRKTKGVIQKEVVAALKDCFYEEELYKRNGKVWKMKQRRGPNYDDASDDENCLTEFQSSVSVMVTDSNDNNKGALKKSHGKCSHCPVLLKRNIASPAMRFKHKGQKFAFKRAAEGQAAYGYGRRYQAKPRMMRTTDNIQGYQATQATTLPESTCEETTLFEKQETEIVAKTESHKSVSLQPTPKPTFDHLEEEPEKPNDDSEAIQ